MTNSAIERDERGVMGINPRTRHSPMRWVSHTGRSEAGSTRANRSEVQAVVKPAYGDTSDPVGIGILRAVVNGR